MVVAPCTVPSRKNRSVSRYQGSPAVLEVSTISRAIPAVSPLHRKVDVFVKLSDFFSSQSMFLRCFGNELVLVTLLRLCSQSQHLFEILVNPFDPRKDSMLFSLLSKLSGLRSFQRQSSLIVLFLGDLFQEVFSCTKKNGFMSGHHRR